MRTTVAVWLAAALAAAGCEKSKSDEQPKNVDAARPVVPAKATRPQPEPLPPPPDVAAPPADAQRTASGLSYKVLKAGTGTEKPNEWDSVTVHYTGWTTDGKMFDSSRTRNRPSTFALNRVIPGWTEGLQLMTVGEQTRFWIPEELAYKGRPGKPQGMLVFDVELMSIKPGPKPVPAPPDVAAPPKDAKKTAGGVSYKVLAKGKGKASPKPTDWVKTNFTSWTTAGKMVDSSTIKGRPAVFKLDGVIKGVGEGMQGMVAGEKRRLWIPEEMAYKGAEGPPKGMLVYEVELLEVLDLSAPPDVAAPPKDAEKTASGLASKVLRKGTGTEKPKPTSRVEVHYTGWTTDGKMFDSSLTRGDTIKFLLSRVIPGWTEGLQLMTVGERRRFWIPEELAYKGRKGAPQGMLVFDVELISFEDAPAGAHGMPMAPRPGASPTK